MRPLPGSLRAGMLDAAFGAAKKAPQQVSLGGLVHNAPGRAQMFADFMPAGKFTPAGGGLPIPKVTKLGGVTMSKNAYYQGAEQALIDAGIKVANFPGAEQGAAPGQPGDAELEAMLSQMSPEELAQLMGGMPDQTGAALGAMPEPTLEEILMKLPPQEQQVLIAHLQGAQGGGAPAGGAPAAGGNPFAGGAPGGEKPEGGEKGEKAEKPGPFQPGEKKEKPEGGEKSEKKDKGGDKPEGKKEKKEEKDEE